MSGVVVVTYLIKHNAPVLALVPVGQIIAGDAKLGTPKPLILVGQIDSNPLNFIRINEAQKLYTDRVQVSCLLNDSNGTPPGLGYPALNALLKLIPAACPSQRGTVNGISVDSIIPLGEGPDLPDPEIGLVSRSTDFFVKWIGA